MEKVRNSNFELLRIILMLFIILGHISVHGGFEFSTQSITINRLFTQFVELVGAVSVNIFVFISGYFLISSKKFKLSKVLKLLAQMLFYSILIYLIFIIFGLETFSIKNLIKSLLPVTFNIWWFASTYFVLYLISPFINIFLNKLNKETYKKLLILLFICWSLIPTLTTQTYQSNNLIWFTFIYSVGGYIKLHGINISKKKCYLFSIVLALLTYLSVIFFDIVGFKISFVAENATYFCTIQRTPVFLIALLLFVAIKDINIKNNKLINLISSTTFGIYLIHDNILIRNFVWDNLFNINSFNKSIFLIPYLILIVIIVFVVCSIIELIRMYVIEKRYIKLIYILEKKLNKLIDKFFNSKIIKNL